MNETPGSMCASCGKWHYEIVCPGCGSVVTANVKNMKCTGLKAVSYPDTRHLIKGSTVQICTNTRIFYI